MDAERMRKIMQSTFQQLEQSQIKKQMQQRQKINELKIIYSFLRNNFNQNQQQNSYLPTHIQAERTRKFYNIIESISQYLNVIYNPSTYSIMNKTRPSPFPSHEYFHSFHDLQCLKTIQLRSQDSQLLIDFIQDIKNDIFKEPSRADLVQQAVKFRKNNKYSTDKNELFRKIPSQCETMTADQFQEKIYDIEDLDIPWESHQMFQEQANGRNQTTDEILRELDYLEKELYRNQVVQSEESKEKENFEYRDIISILL